MKNADMPAMPQTITDSNNNSGLVGSHMEAEWSGLTKREYISIKAMQGLLSSDASSIAFYKSDTDAIHIAQSALAYADALLAELDE